MGNWVNWVKTHKLVSFLTLVVIYLLVKSYVLQTRFSTSLPSMGYAEDAAVSMGSGVTGIANEKMGVPERSISPIFPPEPDYAPNADVTERLVVQNSYLSLLVSNVVEVRGKIIEHAKAQGGYMVNAETTNPQDAPSANVTVRIPSDKLDATLETYRSWGLKVVSENLVGTDVTDQYIDLDARIATLEETKLAMESLRDQAVEISDLTTITRELISIQSQIDSLKGMQNSLEENASLAKVTVYLSTDEIALPYAPTERLRPNVIFKLAVRSLVTNARELAAGAIWLAVYSVIWIPLLIIIYLLYRVFNKNTKVS